MGPTASGKTDLAIELANALNGELISVDSALVYRGLDIGSAKPDYPHHLMDIRDPAEPYSAAEFVSDAVPVIERIVAEGKVPILVGGTMLYFKALLDGLNDMPAADPIVRAQIEAEADREGWPALHAKLLEVDPASAARIHPNHSQRLARALEVYRTSGIPMSDWQSKQQAAPLPAEQFRLLQIALCPQDRAVLHERIALRFEQMMAAGFLEEVRQLHERGDLEADLPAIRAVGYRQLWEHLEDEAGLEAAVERGIAATRQLAKRQLTWLRKWPDLVWISTDREGNVVDSGLSDATGMSFVQNPCDLVLNSLS
ncbi:MAG: tRNA (adenosine(37)-N6)-dimethylallyltransferase MiaA [Halioglobus sp.]